MRLGHFKRDCQRVRNVGRKKLTPVRKRLYANEQTLSVGKHLDLLFPFKDEVCQSTSLRGPRVRLQGRTDATPKILLALRVHYLECDATICVHGDGYWRRPRKGNNHPTNVARGNRNTFSVLAKDDQNSVPNVNYMVFGVSKFESSPQT